MDIYTDDIESATLENKSFRKVVFTGEHEQLVLMSLAPGEDIGEETHDNIDQFFRFEKGVGKAVVNGQEHPLKNGTGLIIPAGTKHNIINTSDNEDLKLYTIYSSKQHPDGAVFATKKDAEKEHEVMKADKKETQPQVATTESFDMCPGCFGKGYIALHTACGTCNGNGIIPTNKTINKSMAESDVVITKKIKPLGHAIKGKTMKTGNSDAAYVGPENPQPKRTKRQQKKFDEAQKRSIENRKKMLGKSDETLDETLEKAYHRWFSRDEESKGNPTLYRRYHCPNCDAEAESSYNPRTKKMHCDKCDNEVEEIKE
jgi:mannose-6-phosphate isomerase-like protein (cupin superfamily)